MRRFAVLVCLALGLAMFPRVAKADPIGTNHCELNALGQSECDIWADFGSNADHGASALGISDGNLGGYLLGYVFLLNASADLSDGFQAGDVANILVIHDSLFELFTNSVFITQFNDVFAAASTGAAIDGVSISTGQTAGCPPITSGVPQLGGVGYCTTADMITIYPDFGFGNSSGGNDVLNIHTALPESENPPPTGVPEPASLSLFGIGAAGMFITRRRLFARD